MKGLITISYRHFDTHIKSLLHFDFPYYGEPNDALNDEILGTVWTRNGSVKFVGSESPADAIITGTPKFGYRCLHSQALTDYIATQSEVFYLNSEADYEFSFFIRPTASQSGNIITLLNNDSTLLNISIDSDLHIAVNSSAWSLAFTSTNSLSLNTWSQCAVRFSGSNIHIIIDGSAESATVSRSSLYPDETRIGGFNGQLDEFMFRDRFSASLPAEPVQAEFFINDLGGFGSGLQGAATINSNCIFSTCADFSTNNDKSLITLGNIKTGYFGTFTVNDEVMLLNNETGEYEFHNILDVSSGGLKLSGNTSINGDSLQVIKIPNFKSLTINSGITVTPHSFSNNSGGIVAFRCQRDCTINGKIITHGYGRTRKDLEQVTHAKLIDNFICNKGGGIFIACGGTLTLPSEARLGATWSGAGKGGTSGVHFYAPSGGAGYGGGGGSFFGRTTAGDAFGSAGGVGVGGATPSTKSTTANGRQGINAGGNSPNGGITGGGGAGGNSGTATGSGTGTTQTIAGSASGANIIILANILNADAAALSTGGAGGWGWAGAQYVAAPLTGGGGTGFCYIACRRLIDNE